MSLFQTIIPIQFKTDNKLSKEQQKAFSSFIQKQNLFITGPGGTGKSQLIKYIYDYILKHTSKKIQVTALTGCAAVLLNCNAKTLHSWSGVGIDLNKPVDSIVKKIKTNYYAKKMWYETDILIVDEISMLSLKFFEILNSVGKKMRKNLKPFGGIQVIFSGDFFQLPPVGNKEDPDSCRFCFESSQWNDIFEVQNQIIFKTVFRQSELEFISILNQVREGRLKSSSLPILQNLVGKSPPQNLITEPTKLLPTRYVVDKINKEKMVQLEAKVKTFKMEQIHPTIEQRAKLGNVSDNDIKFELQFLKNSILCEEFIDLKIGAQVMCIVNITDENENSIKLCNGSQGIVTKFCTITSYPFVKFNNGVEMLMKPHTWSSEKYPILGISQVPLILAWALTIHKSQGSSLDIAEIDVGSKIFECGQTYVALSRVKSLDGLILTGFDVSKIKVNKKVVDFYNTFQS